MNDIQTMAFQTEHSHYEFLVVSCGLTYFVMILMNFIFFKKIYTHFNDYVYDDIMIYSCSEDDHVENIRIPLKILNDKKLYAKFYDQITLSNTLNKLLRDNDRYEV